MSDVDPRIEGRRDEVRRQRRRSLLVRLGLVGSVVLLVAAAFLATRSPILDVDRVTISGSTEVDADTLVAAAGVDLGDAMTDVDLGGAEESLEALPWVATASVARKWPATVEIALTERTPVATVTSTEGAQLAVDAEGRVLQPVDDAAGLLPLVGVEAAEPGEFIEAGPLLDIAGAMPVDLASRISGASAESSAIELTLLPSGTVHFGPASAVDDKFVALRTLLAQVDQRCLADVDLRVARRPTVTREAACLSPIPTEVEDVPGVDLAGVGEGDYPAPDGVGSVGVLESPVAADFGEGPITDAGFPIHPVTGLPYDPAVGMQWDPVTGQPVDPATGQGYDPPPLG